MQLAPLQSTCRSASCARGQQLPPLSTPCTARLLPQKLQAPCTHFKPNRTMLALSAAFFGRPLDTGYRPPGRWTPQAGHCRCFTREFPPLHPHPNTVTQSGTHPSRNQQQRRGDLLTTYSLFPQLLKYFFLGGLKASDTNNLYLVHIFCDKKTEKKTGWFLSSPG